MNIISAFSKKVDVVLYVPQGNAVFQYFTSHWNALKQMDCVTDDSIIALIKNVHAFNFFPLTFCDEPGNEMVLSLSADR